MLLERLVMVVAFVCVAIWVIVISFLPEKKAPAQLVVNGTTRKLQA